MVDFLLQEGVIESLMHFVIQIGTSLRRPAPSDVRTEELKLGYKYVDSLPHFISHQSTPQSSHIADPG